MIKNEELIDLLNKDPYQLKRTSKCNKCNAYFSICNYCGYIHPPFLFSTKAIKFHNKSYSIHTVAKCKLLYSKDLTDTGVLNHLKSK